MLTEREKQTLTAIKNYVDEHQFAPTIRELAEIIGVASTSTVHIFLKSLEKKGYIERNKTMPRTIRIKEVCNE